MAGKRYYENLYQGSYMFSSMLFGLIRIGVYFLLLVVDAGHHARLPTR